MPAGETARTSRGLRVASGDTLILTLRVLLSLVSAGEMPPSLLSNLMEGFSRADNVAVNPGSPLKSKLVTPARFSPDRVTSTVEPRCSQSCDMELSLGAGWASRETSVSKKAAQTKQPRIKTLNRPMNDSTVARTRHLWLAAPA